MIIHSTAFAFRVIRRIRRFNGNDKKLANLINQIKLFCDKRRSIFIRSEITLKDIVVYSDRKLCLEIFMPPIVNAVAKQPEKKKLQLRDYAKRKFLRITKAFFLYFFSFKKRALHRKKRRWGWGRGRKRHQKKKHETFSVMVLWYEVLNICMM